MAKKIKRKKSVMMCGILSITLPEPFELPHKAINAAKQITDRDKSKADIIHVTDGYVKFTFMVISDVEDNDTLLLCRKIKV